MISVSTFGFLWVVCWIWSGWIWFGWIRRLAFCYWIWMMFLPCVWFAFSYGRSLVLNYMDIFPSLCFVFIFVDISSIVMLNCDFICGSMLVAFNYGGSLVLHYKVCNLYFWCGSKAPSFVLNCNFIWWIHAICFYFGLIWPELLNWETHLDPTSLLYFFQLECSSFYTDLKIHA